MSLKYGVSLALFLAGAIHGQAFRNPPTQTSLTAAGQNQRFAVGSAVVNGSTYIAYTASNGQVFLAHDTNGNLQFSSPQAVSEFGQGVVSSSSNPALAYDSTNGRLYLSYITNGTVILDYATDPSQPFQGRFGVANGAVASPGITVANGNVYVGYLTSGDAVGICSVLGGTSPSCTVPSGSFSVYGPGLAVYNGQLYTFFEADKSSHSLYYFVSSLNGNGTIAGSTLSTGAASDQTSGQPSVVNLNNGVLLLGFRSNDGSTYFDTKTFQNGTWSRSSSASVGMNGAPSLIAVPGTITNFYVGKNNPFYVYATTASF